MLSSTKIRASSEWRRSARSSTCFLRFCDEGDSWIGDGAASVSSAFTEAGSSAMFMERELGQASSGRG